MWVVVTMVSAAGISLFGLVWDFHNTAELGESFGVFGALAAGLAAYYTFVALAESRTQRAEFETRQLERDAAERLSRADENFYRLLDLRRALLADLSVETSGQRISGTDAVEMIAEKVRGSVIASSAQNAEMAYNASIGEHLNDSAHYLRFTYHIVKFVVENYSEELQYERVRILRALLSNSEQLLIAFNCMYGAGQGQFKLWLEQFAMLHNLSERDKLALKIDAAFKEGAFRRTASSVSMRGSLA